MNARNELILGQDMFDDNFDDIKKNFPHFLNIRKYFNDFLEHNKAKYTFYQKYYEHDKCLNNTYTFLISNKSSFLENPTLVFDLNIKSPTNNSFETVDDIIRFASELVESIELEIGGSRIDKIYGYQLYFGKHLYNLDKYDKYYDHISFNNKNNIKLYIPIPFDLFYGKNIFPSFALDHSEVRMHIKAMDDPYNTTINGIKLKLDEIYISKDVETILKSEVCVYPIIGSQFTGREKLCDEKSNELVKIDGKTYFRTKINFNYPLHSIMFYIGNDSGKICCYSDELFSNIKLFSRENEETEETKEIIIYEGSSYDTSVNNWNYLPEFQNKSSNTTYGFHIIPFTYSSGLQENKKNHINITNFNNVILELELSDYALEALHIYNLYVFGYHRNFIKFDSGMCGLMFSK